MTIFAFLDIEFFFFFKEFMHTVQSGSKGGSGKGPSSLTDSDSGIVGSNSNKVTSVPAAQCPVKIRGVLPKGSNEFPTIGQHSLVSFVLQPFQHLAVS